MSDRLATGSLSHFVNSAVLKHGNRMSVEVHNGDIAARSSLLVMSNRVPS